MKYLLILKLQDVAIASRHKNLSTSVILWINNCFARHREEFIVKSHIYTSNIEAVRKIKLLLLGREVRYSEIFEINNNAVYFERSGYNSICAWVVIACVLCKVEMWIQLNW